MAPATDKQVRALVSFGMNERDAQGLDVREASETIAAHIARIKARLNNDGSGETFIITDAFIRSMATERGGYSRVMLEQFGVTWPPQKGWKRELIGREARYRGCRLVISERQIKRFPFARKRENKPEPLNQADAFLPSNMQRYEQRSA